MLYLPIETGKFHSDVVLVFAEVNEHACVSDGEVLPSSAGADLTVVFQNLEGIRGAEYSLDFEEIFLNVIFAISLIKIGGC